ncbi:MAG: archease [Candidatus Omnitrophica bacterium]|nr:archease [Candidatus Omnitrophota bacterium]
MMKYKILEHTADIKIKIFGKTINELFKNSAIALFSTLTEQKSKSIKKQSIILEAENLEDLLVSWLNELIFLFFTYKFVPANYSISINQNKLEAKIYGESLKNLKVNTEVKAATYHNLRIRKNKNGLEANIIFDV